MGKPAILEGKSNYDVWEVQATSYLATKGHWDCFDGTCSDEKKCFLAIACLNMLLHPKLYKYTRDEKVAKTAWDAIEKAFSTATPGRHSNLLRAFVDLKLVHCDSIADYVHKMGDMHSKLKSAGTELADHVVARLTGLTPDYRPLIMAIENSTDKMTVQYVEEALLHELQPGTGELNETESALMAKSSSKHKNKSNGKSNRNKKPTSAAGITCFTCGETGHYAKTKTD